MNSDPSKSWSVFFKPVKKDQCFDVDIGKILEDFKQDYEQKEKVNFTEAALVIQGAVHTVGLKIDKLHKDAMDLVEYLAAGGDQNEEGLEGEAAATAARRKKRFARNGDPELDFIKKVFEQPDYMGEADDFYSDEDEFTLKDDEFNHENNLKDEDFLPERDHFFTDLHGKARGKKVFDMDNENYICQRNDLWIYRAPFTSNGYIYPQSRDQQRRFGKRHEEPGAFEYEAFLDQSIQKTKPVDVPMPTANDFQFEQQSFQNFEPELEQTFGPIVSDSCDEDIRSVHNNTVEASPIIPVQKNDTFVMPAAQDMKKKENPRKLGDFAETYLNFLDKKTSQRMFAFNKEETLSFNTDRWKFDENVDKRPPKSYEFQWPSMKPTAFVKVLDRATIKWEAKKYDALRQKSLAQIAKQKREFNKTMRQFCAMKSVPPLRRTKAGQMRSTEEFKDLISDNFATGTAAEEIQAELEEFAPQEIVHESTAANFPEGFEEATPCLPPPVDDGDLEDDPYDPPHQEPFTGENSSGTLNMNRLRTVASGGSGILRGNLPDTEIEANVLNWKRTIAPKLEQEAKLPDFNIRSLISEMDTMLGTSCVEDDDSIGCKELFGGVPHWQKSRKFAAMLQMANEMKLEIIPPEDESDPIGKFSVKPLTGDRIHCAGDDVDPHAVTQKRFRALSSPKSSESPAPKRKNRK